MRAAIFKAIGVGLACAIPFAVVSVVGRPAFAGSTVQVQTQLDSTNASTQECTLGDLVADAIQQSAGADAAIIAADELTPTTIAPGSVDPARIIDALRYAQDPTDTVVLLNLTGAELKLLAERSVSRTPQPFDGFLQCSGMQIHYDPANPEGSRVTQVSVDGTPIQDKQTYRIAANHSVADGSFGYFGIWSSTSSANDTKTTVAAALSQYLNTHRIVNEPLQNRISTH